MLVKIMQYLTEEDYNLYLKEFTNSIDGIKNTSEFSVTHYNRNEVIYHKVEITGKHGKLFKEINNNKTLYWYEE